jgi:putative transcriptional regulator
MLATRRVDRVVPGLALALALGASSARSQERDIARLEPGRLLYATPGLPDPNFSESVVLLVEHGAQGSLGLVVNVPTLARVGEGLPALAELPGARLPVFRGGPVKPTAVLFLLRSRSRLPELKRVAGDVYLGSRSEHLREALSRKDVLENVRVYAGYSGWAAGQLQAELRRGGWVVGARDPQSAFSSDPGRLWERVHTLLKRIEARLEPATAEPG